MTTALVSGAVALLVAGITSWINFFMQGKRLDNELSMQREKLREELKTEFMAEQALVGLLEHHSYGLRKFSTIRDHVSGFQDDELRQLLVRSGALRFRGTGGTELWGLRSRNMERLERDRADDAESPVT